MNSTLLVFVIVILPILSVCLGVTVHYVIQPMVESLVDAVHDLARISSAGDADRVAKLETELDELRAEVRHLRDDRRLESGIEDGSEESQRLPGVSSG